MRRFKLHIPTNISFGTEMKSKTGRMIKYTDIRRVVKMCIEFLGYPNYCLLSPKQCRSESRPVSLFQMSLDAVSYLIPYMCGIVSRRHSFSSGPILGAHPKVVVRICRQRLCDCVLDWECMLLEWNGLHSSPFVRDCDIERPRACYRSCSG